MSSDDQIRPGTPALVGVRRDLLARRETIVAMRRDLHRHPELGFGEARTARAVVARLAAAGVELRTGIARTGVLGWVRADQANVVAPRRVVLFRADMDALPVTEETGAPYASLTPGAMHACGHDGHTAILVETALCAAERRETLAGDLAFLWQPAEEGLGGAARMIEEGVLEATGAEAVFGLHLWSALPVGQIAVTAGPFMASSDEFEITITGQGGHAAFPHTAVDAVVAGSYLVTVLQTLVSRQVDPLQAAVVTVGSFHAGSGHNIIAESAILRGTLRTFDVALRERMIDRLREVAESTCAALGAECQFRLAAGYPATVNDREMADFVAGVAAELAGRSNVVRDLVMMGSEDMSYYLRERPGCYFLIGAGNDARGINHPHHSPRFDLDEDALAIGCEMFLRIAEQYFTRPGPNQAKGETKPC